MDKKTRYFELQGKMQTYIYEDHAQLLSMKTEQPLYLVLNAFVDLIRGKSIEQQGLQLGVDIIRILTRCKDVLQFRGKNEN